MLKSDVCLVSTFFFAGINESFTRCLQLRVIWEQRQAFVQPIEPCLNSLVSFQFLSARQTLLNRFSSRRLQMSSCLLMFGEDVQRLRICSGSGLPVSLSFCLYSALIVPIE